MPGQEHAGPARQLPVGSLPADEPCQALSCIQLSTSRCGRLLGDPGRSPRSVQTPALGM